MVPDNERPVTRKGVICTTMGWSKCMSMVHVNDVTIGLPKNWSGIVDYSLKGLLIKKEYPYIVCVWLLRQRKLNALAEDIEAYATDQI